MRGYLGRVSQRTTPPLPRTASAPPTPQLPSPQVRAVALWPWLNITSRSRGKGAHAHGTQRQQRSSGPGFESVYVSHPHPSTERLCEVDSQNAFSSARKAIFIRWCEAESRMTRGWGVGRHAHARTHTVGGCADGCTVHGTCHSPTGRCDCPVTHDGATCEQTRLDKCTLPSRTVLPCYGPNTCACLQQCWAITRSFTSDQVTAARHRLLPSSCGHTHRPRSAEDEECSVWLRMTAPHMTDVSKTTQVEIPSRWARK